MRRRFSRRAIEAGVVAYCVLAGSIGGAIYASNFVSRLANIPLGRLIVWQSVTYVAWALLLPLIALPIRIATPFRTVTRLSLLALVAIPLHATIAELGMRATHPIAPVQMTGLSRGVIARIPLDLVFYSAIAAVLFGRAYAVAIANERAAAAAAQLAALRARLQPHFLFNALQGIAVLIEETPSHAAEMLQKLSSLLRLTLDRAENDVTTLDEELRFLRIYLELETMRFPDRLHFVEHVDDRARNATLPTFLLQPLVENAIRHNLPRSTDPLTITLSARLTPDLEIHIDDNGLGIPEEIEHGTGLTVATEQLRALYGDRASLTLANREPKGARVTIGIPA